VQTGGFSFWLVFTWYKRCMPPEKIAKIEPRLLKGFRDYLPEDAVPLRTMIGKIEEVFRLFGFQPMETPALEYADLLVGKYGPEADKLMYRFVDHGARHVALRYDHTVPLARVMAMNQNMPLPFKRYVVAPVWRADKPQRGRLREFYQCDIDIVGSRETMADAECLAVGYHMLTRLGVKQFSLQINHRAILDGLVQAAGVAVNQVGGVFHAIDKFPKYGEESFVRDTAALGLTEKQTEQLLRLITLSGKPESILEKLSASLEENKKAMAGVRELGSIVKHAHAMGVPDKFLNVDLKIVRGLDYYTGMVAETIIPDLPLYGSVFSGGRYDTLIGLFTGRDVPAVGISLGLGRLFDALEELKLLPEQKTVTQVMIALFEDSDAAAAEKIATTLRKEGIATEVFLGNVSKLDRQLKNADKRGIPWVVWQGPEEKKAGVFAAKHLPSHKQQQLAIEDLPTEIKKLITK
jgi:histidyl-tRNA synthetase